MHINCSFRIFLLPAKDNIYVQVRHHNRFVCSISSLEFSWQQGGKKMMVLTSRNTWKSKCVTFSRFLKCITNNLVNNAEQKNLINQVRMLTGWSTNISGSAPSEGFPIAKSAEKSCRKPSLCSAVEPPDQSHHEATIINHFHAHKFRKRLNQYQLARMCERDGHLGFVASRNVIITAGLGATKLICWQTWLWNAEWVKMVWLFADWSA